MCLCAFYHRYMAFHYAFYTMNSSHVCDIKAYIHKIYKRHTKILYKCELLSYQIEKSIFYKAIE